VISAVCSEKKCQFRHEYRPAERIQFWDHEKRAYMADLVTTVTDHHWVSDDLRRQGRSNTDEELWTYLKTLVRDARHFYRRRREIGEEEGK